MVLLAENSPPHLPNSPYYRFQFPFSIPFFRLYSERKNM